MNNTLKVGIYIFCFSLFPCLSFAQDGAKQNDTKQAIELNNKISAIINYIYNYGAQWGKKFGQLDSTTHKYSELKPIRVSMEKYAADELAEVKAMKDVGGSNSFRMVIIHYLEAEKKLLDNGFIPFEKLGPASTQDQVHAAENNLITQSKIEEKELKKIRNEQDAFAKKNGFQVKR